MSLVVRGAREVRVALAAATILLVAGPARARDVDDPSPASSSPPRLESGGLAGASSSSGDGGDDAPLAKHPSATTPPTWHLAAGLGTDFPLSINVRGQVETPFRLRVSTTLGIMPGPYVDAVNATVVAFGGYDDATANLIKAALTSSVIWRTHVGYRPFAKYGLYGEVGYGLVALGGNATGSQVVGAATGKALPETAALAGTHGYDVTSTLHMADVEVGWDFEVADRFLIRAAMGGAFTFAAHTAVKPDFAPRAPAAVQSFTSYAAGYLDDTYTSYVFSPVVGVGISYRFF